MPSRIEKIKIVVIFGTRPEAIKMAPVIQELRRFPKLFNVIVVSSGQHRELLDDPLEVFKIRPDYDLKIMRAKQSLFDISRRILSKMESILKLEKPDLVLVHGDTPTTFMGGVAAFYSKIPVGHVEAGLRTYDKYNPFPEEMDRQFIDIVSDYYFAPTLATKNNLLREGKPKEKIVVTGNTAIDGVIWAKKLVNNFVSDDLKRIDFKNKKVIFLEAHRRESWGKQLEDIFLGVRRIVSEFDDVSVIFPVHLNPIIQKAAQKIFGNISRVHLLKPLVYGDMVMVLKNCFLVITDSGGLQEEAPVFDKPVLVLRNVTERKEGVKTGALRVVGTNTNSVYLGIKELILNPKVYARMARAKNPYGDGHASERIKKAIISYFRKGL